MSILNSPLMLVTYRDAGQCSSSSAKVALQTFQQSLTIFFQLDTDESGSIDLPEFLAYVARKQKEATEDPVRTWLNPSSWTTSGT